jgi:hypothetical protein
MNKKAGISFTTEELIRLIIGIIGITILIFLAVGLYGIFTDRTNVQQAESIVNMINEKLDYLEKENILYDDKIILESPKNWYLVYVGDELCICKEFEEKEENQKKSCALNGFCKVMEHEIKINELIGLSNRAIKIGEIRSLVIKKDNMIFYLGNESYRQGAPDDPLSSGEGL